MTQHRCPKCDEMLVDTAEAAGVIGRECASCEQLVLIDIVRQLWVRKSPTKESVR